MQFLLCKQRTSLTTPSALSKVASQYFLEAQPPLLQRRGIAARTATKCVSRATNRRKGLRADSIGNYGCGAAAAVGGGPTAGPRTLPSGNMTPRMRPNGWLFLNGSTVTVTCWPNLNVSRR